MKEVSFLFNRIFIFENHLRWKIVEIFCKKCALFFEAQKQQHSSEI